MTQCSLSKIFLGIQFMLFFVLFLPYFPPDFRNKHLNSHLRFCTWINHHYEYWPAVLVEGDQADLLPSRLQRRFGWILSIRSCCSTPTPPANRTAAFWLRSCKRTAGRKDKRAKTWRPLGLLYMRSAALWTDINFILLSVFIWIILLCLLSLVTGSERGTSLHIYFSPMIISFEARFQPRSETSDMKFSAVSACIFKWRP